MSDSRGREAVAASEQKWFRLALVLAAGLSAFCVVGAGLTRAVIGALLQDINTSLTDAVWSQMNRQVAELNTRLIVLRALTWILPVAVIAAFYLVRWALTGKVRPLWPLRSLNQAPHPSD
jgi:hypothetical protein